MLNSLSMNSTQTNKRKYDWKCIINGCDERFKGDDSPKYQLFPFPRVEPARGIWIENVKLGPNFQPTKYTCVCGKHFPDGHPTTANPFPELLLGWECPKRPRLQPVRDDLTRPTARMLADKACVTQYATLEARRMLGLPDQLTTEEMSVKTTTKISTSSYSDYCSVVGCPNSAYVLKKINRPCEDKLFPVPKDIDLAKQWSAFAQLNLSYSSKRGQICSLHFVDKEPTVEHPVPTLYPEYELNGVESSVKMKGIKVVSRPTEDKNNETDLTSFLNDESACKNLTGVSSRVVDVLFKDVEKTSKNLSVTKFKRGTSQCFRLTPHSCLIIALIKVKTLLDDFSLGSKFRVNEDTIEEALKKWIPFLANCLKDLIGWPKVDEVIDPDKAVIMKNFGKNNVVGILDCLTIGGDDDSMKFVIVYSLSGAIIFRSNLYDGEDTDNEVVRQIFTAYIKKLLKPNEILFTSKDFCSSFDELKLAPNVNMRKAIGQFYESRLKKFSVISSNELQADYLHLYDDMITICCGLVGLMPCVEFADEEGSNSS